MSFMGKILIQIPLVTWRDGRPRFWPSAAQRALGYRGEDLRHGPAGEWYTLAQAIAWSNARQAEIAEKRARLKDGAALPATIRRQTLAGQAPRLSSLGHMVESFLDQPRLRGEALQQGKMRRAALSANTIRYYRQGRALLERFSDGRVWAMSAAGFGPLGLATLFADIEEAHGLAQARCCRALLSVAFKHGVMNRMVAKNPVAAIETTLPMPAPRIRYGAIEEMDHLVKVADAIGLPDIGDAILLGLFTGQRQNDRLALEGGQVTGDGILFRQKKKHGQPLLIPLAPELAARLADGRARRREWRVNWPHVLLCEATRRPWEADWYRKNFRLVRVAAATGQAERGEDGKLSATSVTVLAGVDVPARLTAAGLAAMPSLADFRDQDLRDTAVTRLALAGCNKFEIASITGHSLKSIDEILKHYLGMHPELGRSAIGKLVTWMGRQERS